MPITVINRHTYVGNSPTNMLDPSGRVFFVALFAVALYGSSFISSAFIAGAIIGAAGALMSVEALKYGFDTGEMLEHENIFAIATLGAIAGGIGSAIGSWIGTGIFGKGATSLSSKVVTGGLQGSLSSGFQNGALIGTGLLPGNTTDIGKAFLWGAGVGVFGGVSQYYLTPKFAIPTVTFSNGAGSVFTSWPTGVSNEER